MFVKRGDVLPTVMQCPINLVVDWMLTRVIMTRVAGKSENSQTMYLANKFTGLNHQDSIGMDMMCTSDIDWIELLFASGSLTDELDFQPTVDPAPLFPFSSFLHLQRSKGSYSFSLHLEISSCCVVGLCSESALPNTSKQGAPIKTTSARPSLVFTTSWL